MSSDGDNYTELDKVKVSADTKNTNSLPKTVTEATSLGSAVSTAIYENAYGDAVDVRYTVTHLNVKEDVILKKPSDITSYKATYNIKGEYNATLNGDGSVTVQDTEGETLFVIGAPIMYDENGAVSDDIAVSIVKSNKTLEVEYRLSREWLNAPERAYPVTVDPTVSTRIYTGNIKDVSVYMDGVYDYNDHLKPYNRIGYEEPMYLHIGGVPMLPVDSYYVSSAIMLYASSISVFSVDGEEHSPDDPMWVTAQEIMNDWDDWAFNLTQCSSTTVYNNGRLMQFGDIVGSGTNDNITNVSGTTLKQVSIEYEGHNGYDYFFSVYKGVKIDVSDHIIMNVVSAENTEYSAYRPAVIIRYSYTKPPEIGSGFFWTMKNVGSGKYLTIDGAGTVCGSGDTTGKVDGNIFVTYYNSADDFQKWEIERANTKNVANSTNEPLYIQEGEVLYLHATPNAGITWETSNEYTVSVVNPATGAVLGISELGSATISAYIADEEVYSVEVYVTLNDGTYYIRNRERFSDAAEEQEYNYLYIQINNGALENFFTQNEFMELHEKTHELDQRWMITHVEGQYYSIISALSGLALMIPQNKVDDEEEKVVQGTYTASDNQLWRIQTTNVGAVKIANKATLESGSNLVMCASWAVAFAAGNNVRNRNYTGDKNYDEWYFQASEDSISASDGSIFYMQTADEEYFSLETPNSTGDLQTVYCGTLNSSLDSSYMWRFERVGGYYKIYSLNVAEPKNIDNVQLLVYLNGNVTTQKNSIASNESSLWSVHHKIDEGNDNELYYISPKTSPGKFLCQEYVEIGEEQVPCAGIASYDEDDSKVLLKAIKTYFKGDLKGITGESTTIKCYVENGSWYDNAMSRDSLERLIFEWNNLSTFIRLEFCGIKPNDDMLPDRYYIVFKYDPTGDAWQYGEMICYDLNNQSLQPLIDRNASVDEFVEFYSRDWSKADIVIRSSNWLNLNAEEKEGVILHEIGHALKLDHSNEGVWSIMQTDPEDWYQLNCITVYDIYSLKSKWGI